MHPVFKEYRKMLHDFGIDLSQYDTDKLWIDRMIIRGIDSDGKDRKICRLKVTDNLCYTYKFYKNIPKNNDLETYEQTYIRLKNEIATQEEYSLNVINHDNFYYHDYNKILLTSMGKDSKLVEYLLNKCDVNFKLLFNNTTLDCADVYKEVKQHKNIEIITPKNKAFYKMITLYGLPSRFSRWCCSIFKEGETSEYLKDEHNLLFFYGMRNEESATRSSYKDEYKNPKWKDDTWVGCLPIRKWSELEVWLYTIYNNIPINSKYLKGYSRVGCHIACPYYTKSTWILDKYWYPKMYDRFHKMLHDDFVQNEKWCRLNCTESEYHLNWNGGLVRKEPTPDVIYEFMKYKDLENKDVATQYFNKTCRHCGKAVRKKNEVAMNLKFYGRNINQFSCKKCLMKEMNWTIDDWNNNVAKFKEQGCHLF